MTEQTLYTGLLKGAIIGDLTYANNVAKTYAEQIENDEIITFDIPKIYPQIIENYGVLLEKEEEDELNGMLNNFDKLTIVTYLLDLERTYVQYFLSLLSKKRQNVEIIYQNVTSRTNLNIIDNEINEIKVNESKKDPNEAWKVCLTIQYKMRLSIEELYKKTYHSINHFVINNSGDTVDSDETWCIAFSEFGGKLKNLPDKENPKTFYEWRPTNTEKEKKSSVSTYFLRICYFRWKDELRRRKKIITQEPAFFSVSNENQSDEINEFYEREDLKFKLRQAIDLLDDTCKKIIKSKWFGGEFEDGLSNKEVAEELNLSIGTINNNHKRCLEQLRKLMLLQTN